MKRFNAKIEEWDGKSASGNIILASKFKNPKKVLGLKLNAPFWDLKCLECETFNLRVLSVQFRLMNKFPAAAACNKCYSNHLIFLIRKWKHVFSVSIERDYKDYSKAVDLQKFYVFQAPRKKGKRFSLKTSNSVKELERIFAKTKGRCDLCNEKLVFDDYGRSYGWQVDHRFPLDRGGNNNFENLWPACPDCNRSKKNSTKEEFLRGDSFDIVVDI
jgi:5-methylcytosine-specific restriction endonuclease McrA